MKVLLFNGSPCPNGCTYTALCEVAGALRQDGIETELVQVGAQPVAGCIACGKCRGGKGCIFDDGVNRLAERLDEFDGIIVGAPVYYAGPSGQSTAFLDRLFYSAGGKLTGKPAAAVVSCRRGGGGGRGGRGPPPMGPPMGPPGPRGGRGGRGGRGARGLRPQKMG